MEDINDWEAKYVSCKYSERLLNKLSELNQQVTQPVNMKEVERGIYYAKKYHGSQMRQSGDPYYSPDFRKKMLKDEKRGYGGAIELGNDFSRRFVVPSK